MLSLTARLLSPFHSGHPAGRTLFKPAAIATLCISQFLSGASQHLMWKPVGIRLALEYVQAWKCDSVNPHWRNLTQWRMRGSE